jgi:hypothetical protein
VTSGAKCDAFASQPSSVTLRKATARRVDPVFALPARRVVTVSTTNTVITMKKLLVFLGAVGAIGSAAAQSSVGVSIGINQPGVYGRIDIGALPAPAVLLPRPVIAVPPRVVVERAPIYLYVPPEHQRDWRHACYRYQACGQPVYFVRDEWVRERYGRDHPGWDRDRRADRHAERRYDDRHDGEHGRGRGHGHDSDRDRRD